MEEIKENDLVALLVDLPEHRLRRGDVGSVLEIFSKNEKHPTGYIVEFVTESGSVYAQADITNPAEIMPVRFKREAA
jgi:hypothetical protein